MRKVPITIMRGGTSKGVFIQANDAPYEHDELEAFLLDIMGSPDQLQVDGIGGGNSLTSKVAIIDKATRPDVDVNYTFAQVSINERFVDFKGNCGNISSAVGPYAIIKGLVQAVEPVTTVRILNTNTNKIIVAEVEVENGEVKFEGQAEIPGVKGTGSPIYLSFEKPEGAVTGKTFPTGNKMDTIQTKFGEIPISIVDIANPIAFIRAKDIQLKGTELPEEFTDELLDDLEEIRSIAAEMCHFAPKELATLQSPAVPKLAIISEPADYVDTNGILRRAADMDIIVRMLSMQRPHQALAITGSVCVSASCFMDQTLPAQLFQGQDDTLRIGHPAGIMQTEIDISQNRVKVIRTAREILDGVVFTKKDYMVQPQIKREA
ncbi:2-methylaconitate cis-trans-isomerase PrpF [Bacillus sp. JUb11]|uniref:2-methylaconitate cis-trans isomerase PrpF family protein n=1 Tax=Bacillus sp. JUb11 TaxID=2940595 RepID=UPI0021674CBC|nr:PrpF domain-containing protein [Bacillus sp. JUb11]MCS3482670.1 2-methylaconitate cis-trans-isomerase PrpF [Bacillus sp. JUb11]